MAEAKYNDNELNFQKKCLELVISRSTQASLSDAREAFINAVVDVLSAYKFSLNIGSAGSGLLAPECLKLLPLYIAAILKHPAFRIGISTRYLSWSYLFVLG